MYIRLVATFCNLPNGAYKIMPKEAHIDNHTFSREGYIATLKDCVEVLNSKIEQIKKMVPAHLKNKDFDFIVYGDYLVGFDYNQKLGKDNWHADVCWSHAQPIFNIKQLGVPEENRPIIKTS